MHDTDIEQATISSIHPKPQGVDINTDNGGAATGKQVGKIDSKGRGHCVQLNEEKAKFLSKLTSEISFFDSEFFPFESIKQNFDSAEIEKMKLSKHSLQTNSLHLSQFKNLFL
jgi:hypothetical protein